MFMKFWTLASKLRLIARYYFEKDTPELKECFRFLFLTSRSFAAMIMQLHSEVRVPICLFYLVLRGLDTIEDDMTIDIKEKDSLLRNFYTFLEDESWTYNGNAQDQKDRELLVKFDVVTKELNKIKKHYKIIIADITKRMGEGMADYASDAEHNQRGIQTIKEYEIYCHYVAGLVGEGLTRILVKAEMADPLLLESPEIMESMAQVLQQTNIIRDVREDHEEKRYFWPKEVWSKYFNQFSDIFLPENKEKALECQSEMILLALQHVRQILPYITRVSEQSAFSFVTIPETMAVATLELCFQNYAMFERNIKITRMETTDLIVRSQNVQGVCEVFREYIQKFRRKNQERDSHFLDITNVCDEIEKCAENESPTKTNSLLPKEQKAPWPPRHNNRNETYNTEWSKIFVFSIIIVTFILFVGVMTPHSSFSTT